MVDIPMDEDDDLIEMVKRVCVCGHTLLMHGFTMGPHGLTTSICILCKCKKFQDTGIIDDTKEGK